jgi:hypothetical protein
VRLTWNTFALVSSGGTLSESLITQYVAAVLPGTGGTRGPPSTRHSSGAGSNLVSAYKWRARLLF